ncbi:Bifunctional hemolysin/adenylate cyclase precursor [compost metagenome]
MAYGGYVQNYYGSFYYDAYGLAGGTVTGSNYYEFGTKVYEITGLNHSALMVESYLDYGDANGLLNYVFSGNDRFNGSQQNDILDGYNGNDLLFGNGGNDVLYGGNGNDTLNGGIGIDTLYGGQGNDLYYVDNAADVVAETSATGGIDTVVSSVNRALGLNQENLTLSGSAAINGTGNGLANTLTGNAAANVLNGSTGADTMVGGLGNDTYYVDNAADVVSETSATGGIDTLISSVSRVLGANQEKLTLSGTAAANATGNALANTLTGNAGNNQLNGGAGNDTLSGGAGNDRLTGGTGKDSLIGGTGNDTFFFGNLADMGLTRTTWDLINDFTRGADRIDLSALDANTGTLANDAFSAVIGSTSAFTAAGQLKFNGGVLYGNTDADTAAEFAIQLTGVTALSTADFIV